MKFLTGKWPFYLCAIGFAGLFLLQLYLLDRPAALEAGIADISEYGKTAIESKEYRKVPPLNFSTGLFGGIVVGGLIGGLCSKKVRIELSSTRLKSFPLTVICGLAGGFLLMLGSRIAGDAFLGQFSAAMQLSPGAWLYLAASFLTAGIILVIWLNSTDAKLGGGAAAEAGKSTEKEAK